MQLIVVYRKMKYITRRRISPASSTTKTDRHEIAEILLKVALNTKNQIKSILLQYDLASPLRLQQFLKEWNTFLRWVVSDSS